MVKEYDKEVLFMRNKNKDVINYGKQIQESIYMERANYQGFVPSNYLQWKERNKNYTDGYKNL